MPEVSLSVVIALVTALFSAGVTWGVMRSKIATTNETLNELKQAITELKNITAEYGVLKASNVRNERDIANHETRINALEIAVSKLQAK